VDVTTGVDPGSRVVFGELSQLALVAIVNAPSQVPSLPPPWSLASLLAGLLAVGLWSARRSRPAKASPGGLR
jgi:hypothetical protein